MRNSTVVADSIFVIGTSGQLGHALVQPLEACAAEARVPVDGADLPEVDLADSGSIRRALERIRPRAVINAAAYTDVDGCESRPDLARAVNAAGPGHLAAACREIGAKLVHVSTDYVFDGRKRTPYMPEDVVNPQSVYGRTKAEGEQRVREALPDHAIVRTSWLFGAHGKNFVKTILRLAREQPMLRVVTDQVGRPTYAPDLAAALLGIAQSDLTGTYHFANAGVCSWHQFACEIVRLAGLITPVRPIGTAEMSRPAARPTYSVLDTAKLTDHTGIRPRPWQEALAECMRELRGAEVLSSEG